MERAPKDTCYIVIFEVSNPTVLAALKDALKSFRSYCPLTKLSWAITTNKRAKEVRDQLAAVIGPADRLFVVRSGTEAAWRNPFGPKNSDWLRKNL